MDRWYALLERVLEDVRTRGPPDAADMSLMAHLLRIVDPATGAPLTDAQLLPEVGIVFVAGMETSGKTMGWTLCAPCAVTQPGRMNNTSHLWGVCACLKRCMVVACSCPICNCMPPQRAFPVSEQVLHLAAP